MVLEILPYPRQVLEERYSEALLYGFVAATGFRPERQDHFKISAHAARLPCGHDDGAALTNGRASANLHGNRPSRRCC
jgi:hypothetical protein